MPCGASSLCQHAPEECLAYWEDVLALGNEDQELEEEDVGFDPSLPEDGAQRDAVAHAGKELTAQRRKALIRKLHVNTGHASVEQTLRLAWRCKVSDSLVETIKSFRCPICEELKVPPSRRVPAISHTDRPNEIVGIDCVQVELKRENESGLMEEIKVNALTCVDLASDFAQQIIIPQGKGQMSRAFHNAWGRPYGIPKFLLRGPRW